MWEKYRQIFAMLDRNERHTAGIIDQNYLNQACLSDMTLFPLEYKLEATGASAGARKCPPACWCHQTRRHRPNSGLDVNEKPLRMMLGGHKDDMAGYVWTSCNTIL